MKMWARLYQKSRKFLPRIPQTSLDPGSFAMVTPWPDFEYYLPRGVSNRFLRDLGFLRSIPWRCRCVPCMHQYTHSGVSLPAHGLPLLAWPLPRLDAFLSAASQLPLPGFLGAWRPVHVASRPHIMRGNAVISSQKGFQAAIPAAAPQLVLRIVSFQEPLAVPQDPWSPPNMSFFGFWSLLTALLILLCCPGSGEQEFEVYMWPEKLAVEMRGSMEVNCSTSCPQPDMLGLETPMNKTIIEKHLQWRRFLISNIYQDTVFYCHFTCAGKQQSKNLSVSVYQRPTEVTLKLKPPRVVVGKPFTIECRVPAVKPLHSLTLTLLHGKEILQSQTFRGAVPASQEAATTFNSTAQREDGLLNFSCRAELDLRSLGGSLFHSVSEPQALEVYEPVQDNQMVIIITVVSVLLFLFVTSVLLCFVLGQHLHERRTGTYGVLAAWRRLPRAFRAHPV